MGTENGKQACTERNKYQEQSMKNLDKNACCQTEGTLYKKEQTKS